MCGVLATHLLWRRRAVGRGLDVERAWLAVWTSGVVLWALLLLVGSVLFSAGMAYLALWWVLPSALALMIAARWPRWRWWAWLASAGIGLLCFVQLASSFIPILAAMSGGMIGVPVPQDVTMAVVCWLFVILPLATGALAGPHRAGQIPRALVAFAALSSIALTATALRFPYTAERPKPVMAVHADGEGKSALLLASLDYPPLQPALSDLGHAVPPESQWPNAYLVGRPPEYSHQLPAPHLTSAPPRLEVVSTVAEPDGVTRTVRLRVLSHAWSTTVELPGDRLLGWSLGDPLPTPLPGRNTVFAVYFSPDPAGEELTLRLKGTAPVDTTVIQVEAPGKTSELLEVQRQLPNWVSTKAFAMHVIRQTI